MRSELAVLSRRARLINWAISLCTVCALLICAVIVSLFLGPFLQLDLSALVAWVFIAAMIALCSALVSFLREIFVATRHLRIGASCEHSELQRTGGRAQPTAAGDRRPGRAWRVARGGSGRVQERGGRASASVRGSSSFYGVEVEGLL
jgi:hypothetical protein